MDEDDEHIGLSCLYFPGNCTFTDQRKVPIQIIHEEDDGGDDMGSDEEDYILENGGAAGEEVFGFGDSFVNASNREGGGVFVHRRRDNGVLRGPF